VRVRASATFLSLLPAVPCAVFAAAPTPADSNVPVIGVLQVVVALGLVLAAIAAFAWFLRRLTPGSIGSRGLLRILGGVMVGPKERVVLVEVGDTWLLLGVAASGVNLLHTLPKPPLSAASEQEPAQPGFRNALLHALANRGKKS
jgi:flagellar protein FliO/FliZ